MTSSSSDVTVLQRLGGVEVVRTAVGLLYSRLVSDDRVSDSFKGTKLDDMQEKQVQFILNAIGHDATRQPGTTAGTDQREIGKQEKGSTPSRFDVVVEHLAAAFEQLKVPKEVVKECMALLGPTPDVFTLPSDQALPMSRGCPLQQTPATEPPTLRTSVAAPAPPINNTGIEPPAPQTIFQRLGGVDGVRATVDIFYGKLVRDDRVSRFLDGYDITVLKMKQVLFMQYAFGGAEQYNGRSLYLAHKRLLLEEGLNQGHFDIVVRHFADTLTQRSVAPDVIAECVAVLNRARDSFQLREEDEPEQALHRRHSGPDVRGHAEEPASNAGSMSATVQPV